MATHEKASARTEWPSFFTYRSAPDPEYASGAVVDLGACASVVGKNTLDAALEGLGLKSVPDCKPTRAYHRFGTHTEKHETSFAVRFPFWSDEQDSTSKPLFDITFDVIDGDLPFLVGLPSLFAMRCNLNFNGKWIGFKISNEYVKLTLVSSNGHILLPFKSELRKGERSWTPQSRPSTYYSPRFEDDTDYDLSDCESPLHPSERRELSGSDSGGSAADAFAEYDPEAFMSPPGSDFDEISSEDEVHSQPGLYTTQASKYPRKYGRQELQRIHLHLKHASRSQMMKYLKIGKIWKPRMKNEIDSIISTCNCQLASPPKPHPVVGTSPPSTKKQECVSLDNIFFAGRPYLHCVDHATKWSETSPLRSRKLQDQVTAFRRMQVNRHGVPRSIMADNEYAKEPFTSFCKDLDVELIATPADSHECNGLVERANRTLRMHHDRLRACDKRSNTDDIVSEATYAKNINRGGAMASSFELIYGRSPLISGSATPNRPDAEVPSMSEVATQSARNKLNLMLRSNRRQEGDVRPGDKVFLWRDKEGWIGPAQVENVTPYMVSARHNSRIKTASRNRIRTIRDPEDYEMELTTPEASPDRPLDDQTDPKLTKPEEANGILNEEPEVEVPQPCKESTTHHEPLEPMNKIDLSAIRELYNSRQIRAISWSPGYYNVADAMTKKNLTTAALLQKTLREGTYPLHPDRLIRTAEQPFANADDEDPSNILSQTGAC